MREPPLEGPRETEGTAAGALQDAGMGGGKDGGVVVGA